MALQLEGRIAAGNDLLDSDLRDIQIVSHGSGGSAGTFLYAATGQNGGVSVYRVDGNGLASLSDSRYFAMSGITMGTFDVITLDGTGQLILGGTGSGKLATYGFGAGGDLGAFSLNDLPGNDGEIASALTGHTLTAGRTALYMVDGNSGRLGAYVSDGTGAIAGTVGVGGPADTYGFSGVAGLETVSLGGKSWLLAADTGSGTVRSYRIDEATGGLSYGDSLGAADGLGVAAPSAMQVVQAHGATWVLLAASGSGSLSVMKLGSNGQLTPVDHILDTLATRFGGVAALEVIKVGDHVLVLAGGADDGLALFSLLPDGQLVHRQSLAHDFGAGLENITDIEAVEMNGELRIFVTSGAALGISQYSLSLDDLGAVIEVGEPGGGAVLGTAADDLIVGRHGQDRLMGQGGDDILVAAAAGGILSGGAGADIFVLCPTSGPLEVSDFKPGTDRLDMSHFTNVRSLSQLEFTTTSGGIEIRHGTTTILVQSHDGTSLTAFDLWPSGFDTPDRVPVPDGSNPVTIGTGGDDVLTGGAGRDTLYGRGGDDHILGGTARDTLYGQAGKDLLQGDGGKDTLRGGAGQDRLKGGAGDDTLLAGRGNDSLFGGTGQDVLKGEAGQDALSGGADNDTLDGGAGQDSLMGEAGRDMLVGGQGDDTLKGGGGDDTLKGGGGNDTLKGGKRRDTLGGSQGQDLLKGGDGQDVLLGGKGGDTLIGGRGADVLTGGSGRDVFVFGTEDASGQISGHGQDRIVDFTTGKDQIYLDIAGTGFSDLTLTRQNTQGTIIDTGAGTITLTDVLPKHLSTDDFLFS